MIFQKSARFYNLVYKDKNYKQESLYITKLINKFSSTKASEILDIGCGTGLHDKYLVENGYRVDGIDISQDMINIARKRENKSLRFFVGDARFFKMSKKYDVIVSIFDVINYFITENDCLKFFLNVKKHLKGNSIFIFDSWYGPAVLQYPPKINTKFFENSEIALKRQAVPKLFINDNRVETKYIFQIDEKISRIRSDFSETHKIRYFFKPELEHLLNQAGMKLVSFYKWLTESVPDVNSWNVCFIAEKV